jgi:hypothetical protein
LSNKRIIDLEDSSQLDLNDYLALYNSEPLSDHATYKRKVSDVLALKSISVNGKTGNTITINADDISDSVTTKKFVSTAEKAKINVIKTDQGGNAFLAGDGTYKTITVLPEFLEVFMFNYLFQFPNRKYALWNKTDFVHASIPTGATVSGYTRFCWKVSSIDNIVPDSFKIYDVTNDVYIASGLSGYEVYAILDPIVYNTNQSHSWRIEFTTTNSQTVQSNNLTFNWVA